MNYHYHANLIYLNKIDNGLSNKPKRLINRMFSSILAVLFLIRLSKIFCSYIEAIYSCVQGRNQGGG